MLEKGSRLVCADEKCGYVEGKKESDLLRFTVTF